MQHVTGAVNCIDQAIACAERALELLTGENQKEFSECADDLSAALDSLQGAADVLADKGSRAEDARKDG